MNAEQALAVALSDLVATAVRREMAPLIDAVRSVERPPSTYSAREVAGLLGVSDHIVARMLADGRLWTVDVSPSSTRRIPRAAVDALLAQPSEPRLRAVPESRTPRAG